MDINIEEELLLQDEIVKEEYVVQNGDTSVAEIKNESPPEDSQEIIEFLIKEVKEKRHKCNVCDKSFHAPSRLANHMFNHTTERNFHCPECLKSFGNEHRLKIHMQCHIDRALPCHICKKTFKNTRLLNLHLRRHTGQRNHKCHLCGLTFKDSSQKNRHILRHTKEQSKTMEEAKCFDCHINFGTKNLLKDHLNVHRDEEEGICDACSLAFRRKSNLKKHLVAVHGKQPGDKPWTCIYCYKKFMKNVYLRKHLSRYHRGVPVKITDDPIECKFCKDLFLYFDDFQQHALVHSTELRFECAKCGKKFSHRQQIIEHVRRHVRDKLQKLMARGKKLTCPQCGKVCYSKFKLNRHMIVHSDETPFECNICGKKFKLQQYLEVHARTHENGPRVPRVVRRKKLPCPQCGKVCSSKNKLNRHMIVHSDETPFKCNICQKKFKQQQYLERHAKTHISGPRAARRKKLTCLQCGKVCSNKFKFDRHMIVHSDETPFECNICQKKFKQQQYLVGHAKTHVKKPRVAKRKKLTCPQCGKVCFNKFKFDRHMIVHSDETPFECKICRKKFKTQQYLERHTKIHVNEPMMACKICGSLFKGKHNLRRHEKKHKIKEEVSAK